MSIQNVVGASAVLLHCVYVGGRVVIVSIVVGGILLSSSLSSAAFFFALVVAILEIMVVCATGCSSSWMKIGRWNEAR